MDSGSAGLMTVLAAHETTQMAACAARDFSAAARELLTQHDTINVVFSGAESQGAFHAALRQRAEVPWHRIHAFAVDEFYAPGIPREYRVCAQPERDLYPYLTFASVNLLRHDPDDVERERARYEALLLAHRPHLACLGIGISGHLALCEPGCDFDDMQAVRHVEVCEASKQQLMQDPNFRALGRIPDSGLTITLPTLMAARKILVVVPYAIKRPAVTEFFQTEVTNRFPASLLKRQAHATLYLDAGSLPEAGLPT